eukprot:gnl/MRDRNA2_/MRDRNA2_94013_c0_seq1.p1 gnl/MRDRNA2_/MRDRNA2_94013_c0~~gnl/MRDRNA2_/MRDRNA2_94013_c0_seq1.p1  ORF type:complete len:1283 (+),score=318.38 gnl/MRDRNA2_/MRDRNA2_94013_c0_seq1:175-3849(+)
MAAKGQLKLEDNAEQEEAVHPPAVVDAAPKLSSLAKRRGMKLQKQIDTTIDRVGEDDQSQVNTKANQENPPEKNVEEVDSAKRPEMASTTDNKNSSVSGGGLAGRRSIQFKGISIQRPKTSSEPGTDLTPPRPPIRNSNPWSSGHAAKTKVVQAVKTKVKAVTAFRALQPESSQETEASAPHPIIQHAPSINKSSEDSKQTEDSSQPSTIHRLSSIIKSRTQSKSPSRSETDEQPESKRRPSFVAAHPEPDLPITTLSSKRVAHTPAGPRNVWEDAGSVESSPENSKKDILDLLGLPGPDASRIHAKQPAVKEEASTPSARDSAASEDVQEAGPHARAEEALIVAEAKVQNLLRSSELGEHRCKELENSMRNVEAAQLEWENKANEETRSAQSIRQALERAETEMVGLRSVEVSRTACEQKANQEIQIVTSLKATLASAELRVEQLSQHETSVSNTVNSLLSQEETLQASLARKECDAEAAQAEVVKVRAASKAELDEVRAATQQESSSTLEIVDLKSTLEEIKSSEARLKIECQQLKDASNDFSQDSASAQSELGALAGRLNEVESQIVACNSDKACIESECQEMKVTAQEHEQSGALMQCKVARLTSKLSHVESHAEAVRSNEEKLAIESQELQSQVGCLEAVLAEKNVSRDEGHLEELHARTKHLEESLERSERTNRVAQTEAQRSMEEAKSTLEEFKALESQYENLQSLQSADKSVVSREATHNLMSGDVLLRQDIVQLKASLKEAEFDAERMSAKATQGVFLGEELRHQVRMLQEELLSCQHKMQGDHIAQAEAKKLKGMDEALIAAGHQCHSMKQVVLALEGKVEHLMSEVAETNSSKECLQEQIGSLEASLQGSRQDANTNHQEWVNIEKVAGLRKKEVEEAAHRVEAAHLQELGALEESRLSRKRAHEFQEECFALALPMESAASRAAESEALKQRLGSVEQEIQELRPEMQAVEASLVKSQEEVSHARAEGLAAHSQTQAQPYSIMGDMEALMVEIETRYKQVNFERAEAQSALTGVTENRDQLRAHSGRREEQLRAAYDRRVTDVVQQLYEERLRCRAQREETGRMRLDALATKAHAAELWDVTRELRKDLEQVISAQRGEMREAHERFHSLHKSRCSTTAHYVKQFDTITDKLWLGLQKNLEQWDSRLLPLRNAFNQVSGSYIPSPTREKLNVSKTRTKSPAGVKSVSANALAVTPDMGNVGRCGYNPERYAS